METKKRLTRSTRKYIRSQKALIRKGTFNSKKQEELISNLYKKYSPDQIIFTKQKLKSPQDFILPGEGDIISKEAGEKTSVAEKPKQKPVQSQKTKK